MADRKYKTSRKYIKSTKRTRKSAKKNLLKNLLLKKYEE